MPEYVAKGKSKKAINKAVSKHIHALEHGPHASERTHEQNVAAAERIARGKNGKRKAKKAASRRSSRS